MKRLLVVAFVALLSVSACSGDDDDSDESTTTTVTFAPPAGDDWAPAEVATAEDLAQQLRDADIPCDGYELFNFELIAGDYEGRLPVPGAMAECTSSGENLAFEVFADNDTANEFMDAKVASLCKGVTERSIPFEGFAFVQGDGWFIEPDTQETADAIADALDAESRFEDCS